MKKTLALLMIISLLLALFTGCGSQPKQEADLAPVTSAPAVEEQTLPIPVEQPATEPKEETVDIKPAAEPVKEEAKKTSEKKEVPAVVKEETVTFTDDMKRTVTMKKNPQKVVCLYTSYLDLWDLAGGKVIGRPETKEDIPAAAQNAESLGSYTAPNLEKLLALQPDFVILNSTVNAQVALIPTLESNHIPFAAFDYNVFKDYLNMLKIFTDLTDRPELYQTKGLDIKRQVDAVIAKVPKDRTPSALLLLASSTKVSVRMPDTTVGEILQHLGAVNIAYDPNSKAGNMESFSMERVIEKNPDFIFAQTMGDVEESTARINKDIASNPAWGYLDAVKKGQYIVLPKDLFLFKPNDRYGEAYLQLAKILYPDIF